MSVSSSPGRARGTAAAAALLLLYFLAGKLGLSFALVNASASAVWPPAGLALAACLLAGPQAALVIFVGAFLVNVTTAGTVATSLVIAAGNALEALLGAALITRFAGGPRAFERAQDIFTFSMLAAVACTASATVGVTTLVLARSAQWADYGQIWLTWWLGDTAGAVVVAPLAILWTLSPAARARGTRLAEAVASLGAVALVGAAVFATAGARPAPLPFLSLAPLMWMALRFPVREVATGIGVLALIATWTTAHGIGPFASQSQSPNESLLLLQAFMITMTLMMLPVAALVGEQRRIAVEQDARRQEAERARARLEATGEARGRLAAIVESSEDAIISKTFDGVITSWNRAAEKMFGYSAREAIGRRITLIIPQERLPEEDEVLEKLARGERVDPFETTRVTKDGRLVPISVTVSPILHDSGAIVGVSKVARDISERVKREATTRFLDETGRLLAASLDYEVTLRTLARLAIPTMGELCAVDVIAADGSIERLATAHVDPDKERLAETLIARYPLKPSTKFGVPDVLRTGRGVLHPELPAWLEEPSARTEEDRAMLRALALRSLIIVPMTARGRMLGALLFATGSGRRYGEDDFVLAQDLARRAAIAVDNARLYKAAQDANRAKDAFLAVLSHELRTPLTSVLGWARMLASGQLDPARTRQAIETIERNALLQAQLVNDLLDVSRIVIGKVQLDIRPVELVPIVEQALEAPARTAAAKRVRFESQLDPAVGRVMGDPLRLEQIVTNVVGNAVKFTPEGGRVEVRLERDGDHVALVVRDTGLGIEPEALRYIFEAFRQVETGTSRRHGGLGLGLAIARNLAELQQGTLTGASDGAGRGATFTVRFPSVAAPVVSDQTWPGAVASEGIGRLRPLEGIRVLLVEDDADSRTLLSSILAHAGADIAAAAGVEEALDIARDHRVDALVSDIGMPGRDGYDLIEAFRALSPDHRHVPAIAVTALASRQDEASVLAAGFQVYLVKPIDPAALVASVAKALGRAA